MGGYRDFAVDIAQRAGDIMTTNFALGMSKTWKADGSPLTVSDLMINDMLISAVNETYPEHAVVGEEASIRNDENREYVWICDPIDGTVPFSHGLPLFTFSLALVHDGQPVLAVVNDPMSDRFFIAEKGTGATVNNTSMSVAPVEEIGTLVIDLEDAQIDALSTGSFRGRLRQRGAMVTTLWSAVIASTRVATGELAAVICKGGHVWDVAAAALLVTEAGGIATDLRGEPIEFVEPLEGFVLSNGEVHDALLEDLARVLG